MNAPSRPEHEHADRILAQLGQGGMAQIQLAVRFGPGGFRKLYVVKRLRRDIANENYARMFMHEARLAALLSHPNVVQSHEVNQEIDDCYLKMEYLDGQALSRLVRRVTRTELALEVHLFILTELLAGLHHAHELRDLEGRPLQVVHRDVSPGNLFLTYDGEVKLLDFGIAYSIQVDEQPGSGAIKGKLKYMSPEQALGAQVDRRADLYSVGIMLWEAIACAPFVSKDQAQRETLEERRRGYYRSIQEIVPDTSPALVKICEKALALDPDERFHTAEEFRNALLVFLDSMQVRPSREDVAAVMQSQFCDERAQLDAMIRERISSGAHSEDLLALETNPSIQRYRAANQAELAPDHSDGKRKLMAYGVGGLVMLGSATVVLLLALRSPAKPTPTAEPEASQSQSQVKAEEPQTRERVLAPQAPGPQGPAETVRLAVLTTPSEATIILDGERVGTGAVQVDVARDDHKHHLRVEHPGYESVERTMMLDSDTRIELNLAPIQVEAEPPAGESQPAPRNRKKTRTKSKRSKSRNQRDSKTKSVSRKIGGRLGRRPGTKKRKIDKDNPF